MTTTIHIYGPNSLIKGYYPKEEVHLATSYPVEGAKFSQAFRKGLWDGRKGLLNKRTGAFPTGLLGAVKSTLEANGIDYVVDDHRVKPKPKNDGFDLAGVSMTGKYSYQLDACKAIVDNMQGIVKAATNAGKSEIAAAVIHHLGLPTLFLVPSGELMYQTQKRFMKRLGLTSKEVGIIGDSEWSPGSLVTVAIFHTLASRLEKEETVDFLSKIDVLFLDECVHEDSLVLTDKGYTKAKDIKLGDIVKTDISFQAITGISHREKQGIKLTTDLGNYLECSEEHPSAVWNNGCVEYISAKEINVGDILLEYSNSSYLSKDYSKLDYLVGLFAGDGCWHTPNAIRWAFTKDVDWWRETLTSLVKEIPELNDAILVEAVNARGDTSITLKSKFFLDYLASLGFSKGNKTTNLYTPQDILAFSGGMFDAEGWVTSDNMYFGCACKTIVLKMHRALRDLGMSPYMSTVLRKNNKHNTQYKICISKSDVNTFVEKCKPRLLRKIVTSKEIRPRACKAEKKIFDQLVGELCLLSSLPKKYFYTKYLNSNKLVSLNSLQLSNILSIMLDDTFSTDCIIQQQCLTTLSRYTIFIGNWSPRIVVSKQEIGAIKTIDFSVNEDETFVANGFLTHNCHGSGADGYYTVSTFTPAYYRIGLSATPLDRTDGADLRLLATTGDIIFEITNKQLVDLKVSAKADIIWDKVSTPIIPKKTQYPTVYKAGVSDNPELVQKIVDWTVALTQEKLSTLILVEEIEHGNIVDDALWNNEQGVFIPHQFIHGSEDMSVRAKAIEDFDARLMPVLVCSRILDQGVDTNAIDALIVAGSRKSKIKTLQRLGRGLRGQKLIVIEFSNYCHKYLLEHSIQRLKDYKQENCFPIHSYKEGTDKRSMIRDLWEKQGCVL